MPNILLPNTPNQTDGECIRKTVKALPSCDSNPKPKRQGTVCCGSCAHGVLPHRSRRSLLAGSGASQGLRCACTHSYVSLSTPITPHIPLSRYPNFGKPLREQGSYRIICALRKISCEGECKRSLLRSALTCIVALK